MVSRGARHALQHIDPPLPQRANELEYVSALSPSLTWRREFIELTRRFEAEWYGATESNAEAFEECSRGAQAISPR